MRKTGLIFKALIIFVFSVFLLVSCNVPHIDGYQPGESHINSLSLFIDGLSYKGAEVPTVLAMLFVQKELEDSGNWNSQNPRVHIPQEKSWTVCGIEVSAAGDASRSNNDNSSNGFTFEFDNFYLKYEDNNADEDYVYVLNGEVSEVNDDTININGESFDIRWSIDLPD